MSHAPGSHPARHQDRSPCGARSVQWLVNVLLRAVILFAVTCALHGPVLAAELTVPAASDIGQARSKLAAAIQRDDFDGASRAVDELALDGSKKAVDALVQVGLGGHSYSIERYIGSKLVGIPTGAGFDRLCHLATKDIKPLQSCI